jgi:transcriptional regulator with XRE-family HTH domain
MVKELLLRIGTIGTDGLDFAGRLRKLLDATQMTQADLAQRMQVGRATVNQWVLGSSLPSAAALLWLADYFHTDMRYLLVGPSGGHRAGAGVPRRRVK